MKGKYLIKLFNKSVTHALYTLALMIIYNHSTFYKLKKDSSNQSSINLLIILNNQPVDSVVYSCLFPTSHGKDFALHKRHPKLLLK
jgi:hypothetical protein